MKTPAVVAIRPDRINVPVVLVLVDVITKHRCYRTIVPFDLPIRLGMIRRNVSVRDSEVSTYRLEELRRKVLRVTYRHVSWGSVLKDPMGTERNREVVRRNRS